MKKGISCSIPYALLMVFVIILIVTPFIMFPKTSINEKGDITVNFVAAPLIDHVKLKEVIVNKDTLDVKIVNFIWKVKPSYSEKTYENEAAVLIYQKFFGDGGDYKIVFDDVLAVPNKLYFFIMISPLILNLIWSAVSLIKSRKSK